MGEVELTTARFMMKKTMDRFWTFFIFFNYLSSCGFQIAFSQEVALSKVNGISGQSASVVADNIIPECVHLKSSPDQSNSFRTDDGRICCMCPAGKYFKELCGPKNPKSTKCRRCPRKNRKMTYMHFGPHMEKQCYVDTTTCMSPMILVKGNRFNKSRCECPPEYKKFGSLCLPVVSIPPTMNSEERLSSTTRVATQTSRLLTRTDIEEKNANMGTERESFTTSQTDKSVTIPKARLQTKADTGKKNAEIATEDKDSTSPVEQIVTSTIVMNTSLTMTTTATTLLEPELATQTTSFDHAEDAGLSILAWSMLGMVVLLLLACLVINVYKVSRTGRSRLSDVAKVCWASPEKHPDGNRDDFDPIASKEALLHSHLAVATGLSDGHPGDVETVPEQTSIVQSVFSEIANSIHWRDLKYVGRKLLGACEFDKIYYPQDIALTSEKAHKIFQRASELGPEIGLQEILVAVDGYAYLTEIITDAVQLRTDGGVIPNTEQLRPDGDIITDTGQSHTDGAIITDTGQLLTDRDIITDTGQLRTDGNIVTDTGQIADRRDID